jgi:hypothetical protein
MITSSTYECGACGDRTLCLDDFKLRWSLRCGNCHEWVPTGGMSMEIRFDQPVSHTDAPDVLGVRRPG